MQKPIVIMILDGWGIAPPGPGNAISLANPTHIPHFWASFPHTHLIASGEQVGLPSGEDGNTETGHINIGAGRIVYQDLPRINIAIMQGTFFRNDAMLGALSHAAKHNSKIHIMGLLSDSGVHASREHLYAILELMKQQGTTSPVFLHLFTDGRDSPPKSGIRFMHEVEEYIQKIGIGKVATIIGRYYGMDRDKRWERTERAYVALTEVIPSRANSASEAIEQSYLQGKTDEFIEPVIINDSQGNPLPRIGSHDAVIFYNYRIDRPRQLTRAFVIPDFETHTTAESFDPYAIKYYHKHIVDEARDQKTFTRRVILPDLFFVTMTEYEKDLPCIIAFPLQPVHMPIGRIFSDLGVRQLRVSETEKERFVGYYFNGMREDPYVGEDRLIIPSPKVATYDVVPGMAAEELTTRILDRMMSDVYTFIVINFANPDMVGHTGNIQAAVKACQITDMCVGNIASLVLALGGTCIITADHGNVEEMLGPTGEMDTEHSTFPVPFIMIDKRFEHYPNMLPKGKLSDIAPTILSHVGIPVPSDMTGNNLLADFDIGRKG